MSYEFEPPMHNNVILNPSTVAQGRLREESRRNALMYDASRRWSGASLNMTVRQLCNSSFFEAYIEACQ